MVERQRIVEEARTWIGTPFHHAASVKGIGVDCLGLVRGVWRSLVGPEPRSIPVYGPRWVWDEPSDPLRNAMQDFFVARKRSCLGDGVIALFRLNLGAPASHLGIITNAEAALSFVHAYSGQGVVETALSKPWQRRIVATFDFPNTKQE